MNIPEFYSYFLKSNNVVIDSRKIEKNDLFFAFSGGNLDAAIFAQKAINKGALAVIVENQQFESPNENIFYVPSCLEFLQNLALHHRNAIDIPIIALTGSNGKTTTKELVYAILSEKYRVQYTHGNLNNHIGVPLTILSIKPQHEIAVVEMGANHQKEIEFLCSIAKPNMGYITNFGKAHLEGFGGFEGVIIGKSELYHYLKANDQMILINENDQIQMEKTKDYPLKLTFGKETSDYYFEKITKDNLVGLTFQKEPILSNLTGEYNFVNLCAAAAIGLHFGVNINQVKRAIETYEPVNMRSQILRKNGKTLILDTYNANPSSMEVSLLNFSQFDGGKIVIIGDMLELGSETEIEHCNILSLAKSLDFDEIFTVGENFKKTHYSEKAFSNVEELINFLKHMPIKNGNNVLLKASRGITLEKIIDFI